MIKTKRFIRDLLLIKDGETAPLFHFWFIFMLILGIGLAIGRASADALFLARYGVEYLPVIYIALAPLLALVSIFYAAQVDHTSSEKFFRYILLGLIISVLISWILMSQTDSTLIYPVYFIIHKIASELLLVHGNLYLAHNFNTLQAKRLFPLIFTGEQLGCIIGGILVSTSISFIQADDLPLIWAILMFFGIIQLHYWHTRHGASPYFQNRKRSGFNFKVAIDSVYQGLTFTRESSSLRNASFALFFLVIIFYILSYSTNRIFVDTFSNEQDLAEFLGWLTAGTSIITLGIQLFLTNRLIDRFGVRKLNLVFPLVTASAAGALLASFTLVSGVAVAIIRDSLLNAVQGPVRVIFFNSLPGYMQGRAGAVSIAFVMPIALLVCGSLLWGLQHLDDVTYFLLPCLLLSFAFLYYNRRMNKIYTKTLTHNLKDRLYLPDKDTSRFKIELNADALNALQDTFNKLPQARNVTVSLLAKDHPEKAVEFIMPNLNKMSVSEIDVFLHSLFRKPDHLLPYETFEKFPMKDPHIQSTLLKFLADNNYPEATKIANASLASTSPRIRATAAYTILKNQDPNNQTALKLWMDLLNGDKYEQLASLILFPLSDQINSSSELSEKINKTIENLLKDDDLSIAGRTLNQLPDSFNNLDQDTVSNCIQHLTNNADPELRKSATYGLKFLDDEERYKATYNLLRDTHIKVKLKALSTLDLNEKDYDKAINQWLLKGLSAPRVQSIILEKVIKEELISHDTLKNFAFERACDANNYGIAKSFIINSQDELTSDAKLLSLVFEERRVKLLDLALQALTPLCAKDQIAVIRAGLVSKHSQHIANACEILNNIDNQPATEIIEQQLQNQPPNIPEKDTAVKLLNIDDVIVWASNSPDYWVSHITNIVQGTTMIEDSSRNLIERISLLKQTDIFSEVPTDDLLFVAKELEEIKFFDGERVFDINEHGDRMYIIVKGKIGISISPDPLSTDFIVTLGAGSSFGEMNLLDSLPRSATAHALEDTFLLTLEKSKLLGLLSSYPDLALGILRTLSTKIRENHERNNELKKDLDKQS